MELRVAVTATVLAVGVGVQAYALACCTTMMGTSDSPRQVVGNELVLLWAAMAGVMASWIATYLLVVSCRDAASGNSQQKGATSWRPAGAWARIAMWTAFAVATLALGTGTSVQLYKIGYRDMLCLIVPCYAAPAACSAAAIPRILLRVHDQMKQQRQLDLAGVNQLEDALDCVPLDTHIGSPRAKSSRASDGFSLASDTTRLGGAGTIAESVAMDMVSPPHTASPAPSPQPRHYELAVVPSSTTTLAPPSRAPRGRWLKGTASAVICNGPVVTVAALLSIVIQALLFSGTLEQCSHAGGYPDIPHTLASVPMLFPDNIERTVNISITCSGESSSWASATYPRPLSKSVVLIEHVAGYPSLVSKSLQNALLELNHRVCVYDRPGYARSPQGYAPITPVTLERALSSALHSIGEKGPFYVVGHRSGAEYARLFAALNQGKVVGMAFVYPTEAALLSLLGPNQSLHTRIAEAQAMADSKLLPEPNLRPSHLGVQRALAALGTWMTSPPVISDANRASQKATEWALSSPYLAQAQYFEVQQQPQLAQIIQEMGAAADAPPNMPIVLLGVSTDPIVQRDYLAAVAPNLHIKVDDPRGLQPRSLGSVARQISLHISQLH